MPESIDGQVMLLSLIGDHSIGHIGDGATGEIRGCLLDDGADHSGGDDGVQPVY